MNRGLKTRNGKDDVEKLFAVFDSVFPDSGLLDIYKGSFQNSCN